MLFRAAGDVPQPIGVSFGMTSLIHAAERAGHYEILCRHHHQVCQRVHKRDQNITRGRCVSSYGRRSCVQTPRRRIPSTRLPPKRDPAIMPVQGPVAHTHSFHGRCRVPRTSSIPASNRPQPAGNFGRGSDLQRGSKHLLAMAPTSVNCSRIGKGSTTKSYWSTTAAGTRRPSCSMPYTASTHRRLWCD